ncbi:uncharacterized protein LOC111697752 [Eurytemora carolleeae]|uniref:uncharacterized protein LOC111697752 n=1 Tax=Eurytemora carolleeae TaxID=1294199 RepID=UPI000C76A6F1|nr:uncharacterized protein LOC111697752 [Eurytemora carolleeae]|eukprot:XP_023323626.1 uncharacterized protein LOC111697752 [Eurytemora affinis]
MMNLKCVISLFFLFSAKGVLSLRLVSFSVPDHAIQGEDIELICKYDLEGDKLYSVKWYRNGQEFYRYIPTDSPSTVVFKQEGLNIHELKSTESQLIIRNVNLMITGLFRCEVSGEGPLFNTASQETVLVVVDLPDGGPLIKGSYPRYQVGDELNVSCSSPNSLPAAQLKWYINGEEADPGSLSNLKIHRSRDGLETSQLDLRFGLTEKHYRKGDLKLKCTATIATIYWKSNEESVQIVRKQTEYSQYKSQVWTSESIIKSISGSPVFTVSILPLFFLPLALRIL